MIPRAALLPLCDPLLEFSQAIERRMRVDLKHRGQDAWRRRTQTELFDALVGSLDQLARAMDREGPGGTAAVAADVGTIALMIHDLALSRLGRRAEGTDGSQGRTAEGGSSSDGGEEGARADLGPSQDGT